MTFDALVGFYPVLDLASTRTFYEQVLGLVLVRDQQTCLIFKVSDRAYIGFCHHDTLPERHAGLIITLVTDKVDEIYAVLKAQQVTLESPPKYNEAYGIYHFFAQDPNGYRLEVQRFLEPLV